LDRKITWLVTAQHSRAERRNLLEALADEEAGLGSRTSTGRDSIPLQD
jgi:hypothetical protein